jgi:hypothetical protein
MATTYSFGVTNTTASSATLAPVALGMVSNYAKTMDEPTESRVKNKTTSLEQQEMVTYKSRSIKKVGPKIPVYHPSDVQDGVLYSINIQDILRETRDSGIVIDHPIEMWLTVKHDVAAAWTASASGTYPSYVGQVLRRLLGACYTDDGDERFDSLAKSALVPDED